MFATVWLTTRTGRRIVEILLLAAALVALALLAEPQTAW